MFSRIVYYEGSNWVENDSILNFKKIDKIDKPPPVKKKRRGAQITNIRNERRAVTVEPVDLRRIIKEWSKQLCAQKLDNLDERDSSFEKLFC